MTTDDFRRLALSLEGAEEGAHMDSADFRVGGRIFATLASANHGYGNLMLTPEQQSMFVEELPEVFLPIKGGWGRKGMTHTAVGCVKGCPHRSVAHGMATAAREERHGTQETRQESLAKTDERHCSVRSGYACARAPSTTKRISAAGSNARKTPQLRQSGRGFLLDISRGLTPTAKTNVALRARVFAA